MCTLNLEGNRMIFELQIRQVLDPNFPSFQSYWRGDPITALVSCAFIQIFLCKEVLNSCCLNVASQGGSLIKLESLHVTSLTRNLFRSLWQRFDYPFGSYSTGTCFIQNIYAPLLFFTAYIFWMKQVPVSYSLDISFRQTSTESSTSAWNIIDKSLNWSGVSFSALSIIFFPIPKKEDVVSHPVIACAAGKILHTTEFSDFLEYTHHFWSYQFHDLLSW